MNWQTTNEQIAIIQLNALFDRGLQIAETPIASWTKAPVFSEWAKKVDWHHNWTIFFLLDQLAF